MWLYASIWYFHIHYLIFLVGKEKLEKRNPLMQHNLNENIKKYRKEMNLTQADLAEAFGITEGAVSKWESGNTVPDPSH